MKRMHWEEWYELAKAYYNHYGNLEVPFEFRTCDGINYHECGYRLGRWIDRERQLRKGHRSGAMTTDMIVLLDAIGMNWGYDTHSWMYYYNKVKELYNNGIYYSDINDKSLRFWIRRVKHDYKYRLLTDEQMELVDRINLLENTRNRIDWDEAFEYAKAYYYDHGNLNVPTGYRCGKNFNLYGWLSDQRVKYVKNILTNSQIEMLNSIKMVWRVTRSWNESYEFLYKYYLEHGNIDIPYNYVCDDGYYLGCWLSNQKDKYKAGLLSDDHIDKLESLGIKWYIYSGTLYKNKITLKNQYVIKRELLKIFNSYLDDIDDYSKVNDGFIRKLK